MNKRFIKATNEYCTVEAPVAAPYFRRTVELDYIPDNANIEICGLGFYELYVNGKNITKGLLAPYISNLDDYCYYDSYDITSLLKKGKNVIGILLGNGFRNSIGGYIWDMDTAPFRGAPIVALELRAEAEGKEPVVITADESFKTCPSPIYFDDMRYGEYYDARAEIEAWNSEELDDSAWSNAMRAEAPRGELRLCEADPIRTQKELSPVSIIKCSEGYVYDFGVNSAGLCKLNIRNTEAGQKLTFRYFEIMKDGEPHIDTFVFSAERFPEYRPLNQKNIYICKGAESESWMPRFTYHGFRYVLVTGLTEEQATEELLTYHVMNSSLKRHGDFKCSDETVNTLFDMTVNSDMSNFYYFPTDCPHREKNGWTGDAAVSAAHMMMLYDCNASFTEWMRNISKSQNDLGALPGIVPTSGWGFYKANGPAWDAAAFNLPYECWRLRGNTKIIEENAPLMVRYLNYILTRRSEDGTIAIGLGDWASVGKEHCSRPDTPLVVTDTILTMDNAHKAAILLDAIGHTHAASFAREIYLDMRSTVRRELLDTRTCTIRGRTQTGQAMGIYFGVFEPEEEQKAFDVLMSIIREKGDNMDGGMIGLYVLFHVLSRFGKGELAFRMITKREFPSYAYLIDNGETSLIEKFMPDGTPRESHNHHFFGDIARWFIREIAGLKVEDLNTVVIAPDLSIPVSSAEAFYELPAGKVSVRWERAANGDVELTYTCPDGIGCDLSAVKDACKINKI